VLSKPATSSAMVAHRIMELIVDKKLLPEGALSFLVGGAGDLVSHLGSQDVLAFTGSGETGTKLRSSRNVIEQAVRVNVEADSLNAAVLGPDVEPRSDMYELFLKDVVRDMTQKAGQKCTAVRRVVVSENQISSVRSDLAELLATIRVGDPKSEDTRMGPLASGAQLADVREGVQRLGGRHAFGGIEPLGPKGFFLSPVLVEEPGEAVHEREVFGPVASLVCFSEHPAGIVARGNGGLVCSVYSDDQNFPEDRALAGAGHRAAAARARRAGARRRRRGARRSARPRVLHAAGRAGGLASCYRKDSRSEARIRNALWRFGSSAISLSSLKRRSRAAGSFSSSRFLFATVCSCTYLMFNGRLVFS